MIAYLRSLLPVRCARRSPKWPALEKAWLIDHPTCEGCGTTKHLQVHHKLPVHVDPTKELDRLNLMTLCMTPGWECHFILGHKRNWRDYRHYPEAAVQEARQALEYA